jgi:DNA-binding beta-propeller fold protein YncE
MNFRVQVFEDGKFVKKFGELGDSPGTFSRPRGLGFDSEGHIYVADAAFNNYQIFDDQGRLLLYVGNGGANPGQFHLPAGMFVDKNNRIYVVDQLNARVQVFQFLGGK